MALRSSRLNRNRSPPPPWPGSTGLSWKMEPRSPSKSGDEVYYTYQVDNQAIVIPETIEAIRALAGIEKMD